jgi:hypothetical protein
MNIINKGTAGESRDSSIDAQFSIIMKPMKVVIEAIVIFPRNINTLPIPWTIVNLAACFKIRMKAFIADTQKFSEAKAI